MRIHQDQQFEVALKGQKLQSFLLYIDSDYPDDVLLVVLLVNNMYYRFFLDAGISFVEQLDKLPDDEECYKNISTKYNLQNQEIKRIYSEKDEENSKLIFEIGSQRFVLKCKESSHFDDENRIFKLMK